MGIFYRVIDNDLSLSDKAYDVRLNGAILTTIIDAILIINFFTITYAITFLIMGRSLFLYWTIFASLIQLVLWPLKRRVQKKHIIYEDEQLGVINQFQKEKVRSFIQEHIT